MWRIVRSPGGCELNTEHCTLSKENDIDRLRSRNLPPPVAPGGASSSRPGSRSSPGIGKLMDRPIEHGRGPGALGARGRRAERGGRAGGGRALHRDDLPDRRPGARGGLPGVRPRHRAEAQADPERDPQPIPRLAAPRRSCRATATSSSTAPWRTAAPCFARRTSPARPSWPSSSSSIRRSSAR